MSESFGECFRRLRKAQGLGLNEFAAMNGYDPGNISKIERGLLPPPSTDEAVTAYAKALALIPGSLIWYEFHDKAAIETGRIPGDLLGSGYVVKNLPELLLWIRREWMQLEFVEDTGYVVEP